MTGLLKQKKHEIDMCNGPILPKLLQFTLPLMFSSLLQLMFNAADVMVVGRFAGDNAQGAVGSNSPLINLLTNLFMGLSVGANVVVANYIGAKEEKDASETVHTAMLLSIISGVVLTVIGLVFTKQILIWMKTPDNILPLATLYLRIYFGGIIFSMVFNFGYAILRAIGDTARPLIFLMIAGIINVALNLLFVVKLQMGVAGVGIATVIAEFISSALIVICLMREKSVVHLDLRKLRIHKKKFIKILQIGLPASFQGLIFAISNVIIQSTVNSFGEIVVDGNSAAANIEGFVYMAMNSFYQGTISFTSQNLGAGQLKRINKILISALICVTLTGVLMGNFCVFFGKTLLSFYTKSPEVMEVGMRRIGIICRIYALCGIMDVLVGSLRGMGYASLPTVVSLVGACGLRLFWIFTFFRLERFHSLESLYLTYPVSWVVTICAHVICYICVRKHLDGGIYGKKEN